MNRPGVPHAMPARHKSWWARSEAPVRPGPVAFLWHHVALDGAVWRHSVPPGVIP